MFVSFAWGSQWGTMANAHCFSYTQFYGSFIQSVGEVTIFVGIDARISGKSGNPFGQTHRVGDM